MNEKASGGIISSKMDIQTAFKFSATQIGSLSLILICSSRFCIMDLVFGISWIGSYLMVPR
ncbi:hypothetical protein BDV59DRAFT_172567 [Aspergillus ambiguus]|uniref:uncharacterized protein n=1 Tax=Aspergillus ambiguus TaxID=176160 RepID=UPI003CCCCA4B